MVQKKIQLLILVLSTVSLVNGQTPYTLSGNFNDLSFEEFVTKVERQVPVRFFFKYEWIKDIQVKNITGCTELNCMLDRIFSGTSLHYMIEESGNILITSNYAIKIFEETEPGNRSFLEPGRDAIAGESNGPVQHIIEIGNPSERSRTGRATISGYIVNTDTDEPIPGVTIYSQKLNTGTISNQYGYYALSLPFGRHLLHFTALGWDEKDINVNINGPGEMNVEMKEEVIPLKAVVITSEKSLTLQRFEVGAERLNMKTFKLLPTTMGDPDILKTLLLIPGVKTVGEGSAGFNVRGGSADQNLILLYGAPLYNSSHFFGFFSAVNSDIIRDVMFYRGGIPSKYGGRISSVLDISTRDGNRREFAGNAGISPVTSHVTVEGPVIKDTLSYIFAARTTYSNWIMGLISDPELRRSKASFYDLNGKITWTMNKNNQVDIAGYFSHDNFRFNFDSLYRYDNHILSLKWRHFFNSQLFSSVSVNTSSYHYAVSGSDNPAEAFELSHDLNSTSLKADFNWFTGRHEINFGADVTRYKVNPGKYKPNSNSSSVISHTLEQEQAFEAAAYIDDKISLSDFLSVNTGVRFSGFFATGPQTVMRYNPELPRSSNSVTDSIFFEKGQIISKYAGPELRISLNFRISDKSSFKLNYNRTRQYLHLMSNTYSISPTDFWKLSDYYIPPQMGDQVAAGFYEVFQKKRVELSAEVYYKSIRNLIDFKGGTNLNMNENIEKDIIPVNGTGYGLELTLKKNEGKLQYNLGYTWSRIFQRSQGDFPSGQINEGKWFPAHFDKPHDLSVTCSYLLSRRVSFSGNYTISSGRPITFPVASYIIYDNRVIHYSDRNRYRIPDYSRLDLSITINGDLRAHKLTQPRWTFSVYNVLARKNVYSIFFKRDGDVVKGYKLSIFGRAIPSVTYSFDF